LASPQLATEVPRNIAPFYKQPPHYHCNIQPDGAFNANTELASDIKYFGMTLVASLIYNARIYRKQLTEVTSSRIK
jgi:hypothetical protein